MEAPTDPEAPGPDEAGTERAERLAAVNLLGDVLDGLRLLFTRPPVQSYIAERLGRRIDLAKLLACQKIADLSATGTSISVKDVAATMQLDQSTASRLLADAEAEGLVVRNADPHDRRRTVVSLSDAGRDAVRALTDARISVIERIVADFSTDDLQTFTALADSFARGVARLGENSTDT
ncbi:MAG: MarR family transcriptional regulator [Actinomycetota bacterium]|nr:MAG: MarR family transcriptional regulator [Actinomycetota bacterium]